MAEEKSLGLGVVFTGRVSKLLDKAVKDLEIRLKNIAKSMGIVTAASLKMDAASKRASKGIHSFDQYIGKLKTNLKDNKSLMGSAVYSANQLGQTYGTNAGRVRIWGKELDKSINALNLQEMAMKKNNQTMTGSQRTAYLMQNAGAAIEKTMSASAEQVTKNAMAVEGMNKVEQRAVNDAQGRSKFYQKRLEEMRTSHKDKGQMFAKEVNDLKKLDNVWSQHLTNMTKAGKITSKQAQAIYEKANITGQSYKKIAEWEKRSGQVLRDEGNKRQTELKKQAASQAYMLKREETAFKIKQKMYRRDLKAEQKVAKDSLKSRIALNQQKLRLIEKESKDTLTSKKALNQQRLKQDQKTQAETLKSRIAFNQQQLKQLETAHKQALVANTKRNKDTLASKKALNQQQLGIIQDQAKKELKVTADAEKGKVKRLETIAKQRQKLLRTYPELTQEVKSMTRAMKRGNVTYEAADKKLRQHTTRLKANERSAAKFTKTYQQVGREVPELKNKIKDLSDKIRTGALSYDKANASITRHGKAMGIMNLHAEKSIGYISRLGNAFRTLSAYGIASLALYGTINALKTAIDTIVDFDQALKNLQAITGATDEQLVRMGDTIIKVAATTKFSASEVADAMVLLGQAGFTAEEAIVGIEAVAMLATGTLSDMKTAADLLTTAIRAFNLDARESAETADIFASAVNKSKLTIDKIRISFNYLAPIANKAGLSLRETSAAMMVLANNGIRASTIGTGMRQVLSRLINPSQDLKAAFRDAGADLRKLNPLTNDFKTIITELEKVVTNSGKAFELFGLRGAPAIAALTEAGAEGFQKMLTETERAGIAAKMAATQMEGLGVQIKNMFDKLGVLVVRMGEAGFTKVLGGVVFIIRKLIDALIWFAESVGGKAILMVVGFSAALLTLTGIAVLVSASFKKASAALIVYSAAAGTATSSTHALSLALLKNPIGWIILAIGSLVAIWWTYHKQQEKLAKQAEARAKELGEEILSLNKYKKQLKEVTVGSEEHQVIMDNLIEKYPELTQAILTNADSIGEQIKAINELNAIKQDQRVEEYKTSLEGLVKTYENLGKEIKKTEKGDVLIRMFERLGFAISPQMYEESLKKLREMRKEHGQYEGQISRIIAMLERQGGEVPWYKFDKETIKKMEEFTEAYKKAQEEAEKLARMGSLATWSKQYEEATAAGVNFFEAQNKKIEEAGGMWKEYMDSLDLSYAEQLDARKEYLAQHLDYIDKENISEEEKVKKREALKKQAAQINKDELVNQDAYRRTGLLAIRNQYLEEKEIMDKKAGEDVGKTKDYFHDLFDLRKKFYDQIKRLDLEYADISDLKKGYAEEKNEMAKTHAHKKRMRRLEVTDVYASRKEQAQIARKSNLDLLDEDIKYFKSKIALDKKVREEALALSGQNIEGEAVKQLSIALKESERQYAAALQTRKKYFAEMQGEMSDEIIQQHLDDLQNYVKNQKVALDKSVLNVETAVANRTKAEEDADQEVFELKLDFIEKMIEAKNNQYILEGQLTENANDKHSMAMNDLNREIEDLEIERTEIINNNTEKRFKIEDNARKRSLAATRLYYDELALIIEQTAIGTDVARKLYENERKYMEDALKRLKEEQRKKGPEAEGYDTRALDILRQEHELRVFDHEEYKRMVVEKLNLADEYYRRNIISHEEYMQVLDESYQLGMIEYEEYTDKKIALDGTWGEAFQRGLQKSMGGIKTWGELMMTIGKTVAAKISDSFTSAFLDVVEGTKTAGEAFRDMAKDIIKWLLEMIIKQTIFNALSGMMGGGSGLAGLFGIKGAGTVGTDNVSGMPRFHEGGIIGKDTAKSFSKVAADVFKGAPRLHNGGLVGDEVPIIAKKNEGVFTPAQMKALGKGDSQSINVGPLNFESREDAQRANKLRDLIEEVCQSFLREELRNG